MSVLIGPHLSISVGIENVPQQASLLGATTFALFLGNVKRWESKPISEETAKLFKLACETYGYQLDKIVPHAKYMINLCNPDDEKVMKSRNAMVQEMENARTLGLTMVNVHPGSHLGVYKHEDGAAKRIAESVNYILDKTADTTLVLETTAGQGNDFGYRFEHIAEIIYNIENKQRVGVCIDTCHSFAGGYPLHSVYGIDDTLYQFDNIIGIDYLKAVHLNDSQTPLGSRKDRHATIGNGEIGADNLRYLANHPMMENIPMILETPDTGRWATEINFINR